MQNDTPAWKRFIEYEGPTHAQEARAWDKVRGKCTDGATTYSAPSAKQAHTAGGSFRGGFRGAKHNRMRVDGVRIT